MEYRQVQQNAKDINAYAKQNTKPGMNRRDIRKMCDTKVIFHRGIRKCTIFGGGSKLPPYAGRIIKSQ